MSNKRYSKWAGKKRDKFKREANFESKRRFKSWKRETPDENEYEYDYKGVWEDLSA